MPPALTVFLLLCYSEAISKGGMQMIKYACDMPEDSPYKALSRTIKRIRMFQVTGLGASAVLLAMAWASRSRAIILLWMAYCLGVLMVSEILRGNVYRDMCRKEQAEWKAFLEQLGLRHGDWEPARLGFAYRSGGKDCSPVLCYFGENQFWELGQVLKKYFVAYVAGRMIYAYQLQEADESSFKAWDREDLAWEKAKLPHQRYLCREAEQCGRYLVVENFIYDLALANMMSGRPNQPCNTVSALSRMKKELVYLAETGDGAVLAVPKGTMDRVNVKKEVTVC